MRALKATSLWLAFMVIALALGVLRERLMAPRLGGQEAELIAVAVFVLIVLWVTVQKIHWLGVRRGSDAWLVGGLWVGLSVAFHLLVGRLLFGEPWASLARAYNPVSGNPWLLVLLGLLAAPFLAALLRRRR